MLDMTTSDYRAGGTPPHIEIRLPIVAYSLGAILVAQSARGVCAILMDDDPNKLTENLQGNIAWATACPKWYAPLPRRALPISCR